MLRSLVLVGLLCCAAASGAQTAAPLGDRIGPTIDASERDYFGLFPTIYAPLPWTLAASPDGAVSLERGGETLREISPEDAERLTRLIDTFEEYPSVSENPNWREGSAFAVYINARVRVPTSRASSVVRVETAEGSYSGFALYTTDSVLVMAPEVRARDAALPGAFTLQRSDILGLSQQRPTGWQKWGPIVGVGIGGALGAAFSPSLDRRSGAGFGALVGLTAGTLTSQQSRIGQTNVALSSLDTLALFNRARPPELPDASGAALRATASPSNVSVRSGRKRSFEWISVGVHGATSISESEGSPVNAPIAITLTQPQRFRGGILERNRDELEAPFRVDVSVRPIRWARAGVFIGRFTSGDSLRNLPGEEQQLRTVGNVRPYAEAILPLARSGDQRLEIFAGGGLQSYSVRTVNTTPLTVNVGSSTSPNTLRPVSAQQDTRGEGSALFYTAGIELHSTRFSSLFIRHSWYPIPTLAVEEFRYSYASDPSFALQIVEPHEVDFSYRELMLGARFHL